MKKTIDILFDEDYERFERLNVPVDVYIKHVRYYRKMLDLVNYNTYSSFLNYEEEIEDEN